MTNRRDFLKNTSALAATALGTPYLFTSAQTVRAEEASDRLRVGCVGLGGMGRGDAADFSNLADIVALCDVDSHRVAEAQKNERINRLKPDTYADYRKVLDRKDIDVVSIATVDHWHVKVAIEAMQAGKHVFCEKPLTLTVEEGQLIRRAAKKYPDIVFQVGAQQRSQKDQFALATLIVRKGILGKIKKMTVCIGPGPVGGPFAKAPIPESLDWNAWLGQCPTVDYIPQRCHGTFRYWYEYSGGTITDWGAHHLDFVHWALGQDVEGGGPIRVRPILVEHPVEFKDGYPTVDDRYNTSSKFEIACTFPGGVDVHVCSHTKDGNGVLIEGEKGRINVNRERITGTPMEEKWHEGKITEDDFTALANGKKFDGWHKRNFITCIREGGKAISDPVSHVQAMNTCHLCAIAARLNREIRYNPKTEKILADTQAADFLARKRRDGFDIPAV